MPLRKNWNMAMCTALVGTIIEQWAVFLDFTSYKTQPAF